MKIWNFGVNALQLHLFCPHNTHSGDLVLRFAEFFHTFRMRDSTHSCLPPDAGSRRIVGSVKEFSQNGLQALA